MRSSERCRHSPTQETYLVSKVLLGVFSPSYFRDPNINLTMEDIGASDQANTISNKLSLGTTKVLGDGPNNAKQTTAYINFQFTSCSI